jgi:glycerophosphoryl diester phosphodiesterase
MMYSLFPEFKKPMIFGHRGSPVKAPENTLSSFKECVNAGVPGIELDIHRCGSGELVVIHDFSTLRVTGRDLPVEEASWRILKELDAGSWFSPAFSGEGLVLLEDVFTNFGDSVYYDIEIKDSTLFPQKIAEALSRLLQDFNLSRKCLVSSFNPFALNAFKNFSPDVPTAVIYSSAKNMPFIVRSSLNKLIGRWDCLKPHWKMALGPVFPAVKFHPVIPWTVDDTKTAESLIKKGVRGIISNKPDDLLEIIP